MGTTLVINSLPWETRIAVLENGSVVEFHVERLSERGTVGNIYKGKVVRVLPGMQAAFVDIGLERTAFIYVTDVNASMSEFEDFLGQGDPRDYSSNELNGGKFTLQGEDFPPFRIEELLHYGQEIIVQVMKEPVGGKGARVTTHVSIPGRLLVLLPTLNLLGVSRKIEEESERQRLKEIIDSARPKGLGIIARTACEGATPEEISKEIDFLVHLWENTQKRAQCQSVPCLVYEDLDITLRAIRDLFKDDVTRLVVDDKATYERILSFIESFAPHLRPMVVIHDSPVPIFDAYGIEVEMSRATHKKIWLKSGGFIVIEKTEALTVIDVNTGKYVGKRNFEDTIFKTNLEAAKEIACQLRLRNIGGLIIIDFIDMESPQNREEVFCTLKNALKKDRCKSNILKISEMGLVQMTRKRHRESLQNLLCEPCFYCDGTGFLKSARTVCYEIFRRVLREAGQLIGSRVELVVNPRIGDILMKEESQHMEHLERTVGKNIVITSRPDLHVEQYEIRYL